MTWLDILSLAVGITGAGLAIWFYYHLWKWARDCQQATIAVAFKRKVVMSPTLVELVLWSRKVPNGQNGQVFYRASNVTVAIVKRGKQKSSLTRFLPKKKKMPRAQVQEGTWKMRQDAEANESVESS